VYCRRMPYYVYIAECADKTLYTGITTDVVRREQQHNGERKGGAIYTSSRKPVTIVYTEKLESKSLALKRELEIKKLSRSKKLLLIK